MKKSRGMLISLGLGLFFLFTLPAENISIGQIDSSSLLLSQEINLYVSVTGDAGRPVSGLDREMFTVEESVDETSFTPLTMTEFRGEANKLSGIHFLLLIDNSGSMYNTLDSRRTEDESLMRITQARAALRDFITSITNPADTVGLACFNTHYVHLVEQTKDITRITAALEQIKRPDPAKNEDYTELYAALTLATDRLANLAGRKVIIVLSDGKNEPYAEGTKLPHPVFGDKIYAYTEPVTRCQEEGISCFAVDFGGQGDKMLDRIAFESGGRVFEASNRNELTSVYRTIQDRILGEYLLTYRAGMVPADKKFVRVTFTGKDNTPQAVTRFYFSSTLFGLPLGSPGWVLLIPLVLAFLLWFLLTRIKFIRPNRQPGLEVLSAGSGNVLTRIVPLENKATVIGGSDKANLTITGVSSIKDNHATILFDEKEKCYTLVSDEEVAVNNTYVKRKKLEAGDVINVEGTTIVFDDEVMK